VIAACEVYREDFVNLVEVARINLALLIISSTRSILAPAICRPICATQFECGADCSLRHDSDRVEEGFLISPLSLGTASGVLFAINIASGL
jgi:hypothetical protein